MRDRLASLRGHLNDFHNQKDLKKLPRDLLGITRKMFEILPVKQGRRYEASGRKWIFDMPAI